MSAARVALITGAAHGQERGLPALLSATATVLLLGGLATVVSLRAETGKKEVEAPPHEVMTAKQLVQPLNSDYDRDTPLSDAEIAALTQLATTKDENLRFQFVEEATRTPETARQLRTRAMFALHAAVGLDARRRDEVERLLVKRLTEKGVSLDQQIDLAFSLAALGDVKPQAAEQAVTALGRTMLETRTDKAAPAVLTLVPYLDYEHTKKVAALFIPMLRWTSAHYLAALAPRLKPEDAALLCGCAAAILNHQIYEAIVADNVRSVKEPFAEAVFRLAQNNPTAIAVFAKTDSLLDQLVGNKSRFILDGNAQELGALAPYLDAADARKVAEILRQAMTEDLHPVLLWETARALAAVLNRLEPKEAAERAHQAIAILNRAIARDTEIAWRSLLAQGLAAMAPHLEPPDVVATFDSALRMTKNGRDHYWIAPYMAAWAKRQQPKQGTAFLIQAMAKTDESGQIDLFDPLREIANRLDPQETKEVAVIFARNASAVAGFANDTVFWNYLEILAGRLDSTGLKDAAAMLVREVMNETDSEYLSVISSVMCALAARMQPVEAKEVAAVLTQAMNKTKRPAQFRALTYTLSWVARRQTQSEAVVTLTQAMNRTTNPDAIHFLADGLMSLAARLEPKEAKAAKAAINKAKKRTTNVETLKALERTESALAARLDAKVVKKRVAVTVDAMSQTKDPGKLRELAHELAGVVAPQEAKEAAKYLMQAMLQTTKPDELNLLANALSEVTACLDSKEAAPLHMQAATTLTRALTRASESHTLSLLADALATVAARLERNAAAKVCDPAARTLLHFMAQPTHRDELEPLARTLDHLLHREPQWKRQQKNILGICGSVCLSYIRALPHSALQPFPEPLPAQLLVELLKHPLCVEKARRVVLDALGIRYHRTFVDTWDFVRFAEKEKLGLDLTSPPKLP